jgi:glycosyltransferase involved in cell wall biosynthesis
MIVAMVTPLPPQKSGIADYSASLIRGLRRSGIKVSVFSNFGIDSFDGEKVFDAAQEYAKLEEYETIIYQIGNNREFHGYMLDLLAQYPGIVHLHDLVIHGMVFDKYRRERRVVEYLNMLYRYYGVETAREVVYGIQLQTLFFDGEKALEAPMFEAAVECAKGCIVHSEFSKKALKNRYPNMPVLVVPQSYDIPIQKPQTVGEKLQIGVFGGVDPYKRVDIAIEALADVKNQGFGNFELTIVGGISPKCQTIVELPKSLGLECLFAGRVDESDFEKIMDESDLVISLRHPTMGETSAVVTRAMMRGKAVIVNEGGWYSELPEGVPKLSTKNTKEELVALLKELLLNPNRIENIATAGYEYALERLKFDETISSYTAALLEINKQNSIVMKAVKNRIGDDKELIETVSDKIGDIL